jgi:hypothetical protein
MPRVDIHCHISVASLDMRLSPVLITIARCAFPPGLREEFRAYKAEVELFTQVRAVVGSFPDKQETSDPELHEQIIGIVSRGISDSHTGVLTELFKELSSSERGILLSLVSQRILDRWVTSFEFIHRDVGIQLRALFRDLDDVPNFVGTVFMSNIAWMPRYQALFKATKKIPENVTYYLRENDEQLKKVLDLLEPIAAKRTVSGPGTHPKDMRAILSELDPRKAHAVHVAAYKSLVMRGPELVTAALKESIQERILWMTRTDRFIAGVKSRHRHI